MEKRKRLVDERARRKTGYKNQNQEQNQNEWYIDEDNYFSRLDKFLRSTLKNVPLSALYKLIRTGKVFVNGKRAKEPSYKLNIKDVVEIRDEDLSKYDRKFEELKPVKMKLDVLYEDDMVLALNKPSGVSVHPGRNMKKPSLIEGIKYYGEKSGFEPFLVHRLDKETSGVLIVAKSRNMARELGELVSSRNVEKNYIALVFGRVQGQRVRIDTQIDGQEAVSIIMPARVYKTSVGYITLVKVKIETGRKHQIRKHLAAKGFPVVCDNDHGDFRLNREFAKRYGLKRHFLHCESMVFSFGGRHYNIHAPLSEDLSIVLKLLYMESVKS